MPQTAGGTTGAIASMLSWCLVPVFKLCYTHRYDGIGVPGRAGLFSRGAYTAGPGEAPVEATAWFHRVCPAEKPDRPAPGIASLCGPGHASGLDLSRFICITGIGADFLVCVAGELADHPSRGHARRPDCHPAGQRAG